MLRLFRIHLGLYFYLAKVTFLVDIGSSVSTEEICVSPTAINLLLLLLISFLFFFHNLFDWNEFLYAFVLLMKFVISWRRIQTISLASAMLAWILLWRQYDWIRALLINQFSTKISLRIISVILSIERSYTWFSTIPLIAVPFFHWKVFEALTWRQIILFMFYNFSPLSVSLILPKEFPRDFNDIFVFGKHTSIYSLWLRC